jgi:hypothetical protein
MPLGRAIYCFAVLCAMTLVAPAHAAGSTCSNPQSPRNLDRASKAPPLYSQSDTSVVVLDAFCGLPISRDGGGPPFSSTITYIPPAPGRPLLTLHRCSQHYHYPIENPMGCPGEIPATGTPGTRPEPGQWVEVHTAYAPKVDESCSDPETTDCCLGQPVVVRAFSARVTATGVDGPIGEPWKCSMFEWSGSASGPDKVPGECKSPVQWSFWADCGISLSEAQLKRFRHPQKARGLQTGDRLSHDLVLVETLGRALRTSGSDVIGPGFP